ncbi:MAG TPA: hypothetical protein VNA69_09480 [Thermoanaerobaculia bacterium]|nr:hypothetical protein [Thermoanaerobaculia bacterium]
MHTMITVLAVLFGLRNPGDGGRQVITIDPATASITPISASIDPPNGTPSGVIALDAGGGRFFFVGTPSSETTMRIYSVSTTSGIVLANPTISGGGVLGLEYDETEDVLYALQTPDATSSKRVVRLDTATGVPAAVSGNLATAIGMPSGATTMDAAGNRFFFVGTQDAETTQRIYSVDTATGALLASPTISGDVITGLEYDSDANVLLGLRTPPDGGKQVVTLDPATGTTTDVSANVAPSLGMASGVTGLDAAGNRFYFVATPNSETDSRIYTIDTATGALVSNPTIVGSASQFMQGLAWAPPAPPPVITVTIDVRSTINVRSRGVIPVVIYSTPTFDATTIDASSLRFGPGEAPESHGQIHASDVDGDGDQDVTVHFGTPAAAIPCNATSVTLTGTTTGGQAFEGTDTSIRIVGCK